MLTCQLYEELCQGKTDRDGIRALRERGLIESTDHAALKAKQKAYKKSVKDPGQNLVAGVGEFIGLLAEHGISRHLITASDTEWVQSLLVSDGLGPGIAGEVRCNVTHPDRQRQMRDILRCAQLRPRRTLLIDDSETNLSLAHALHIRTVHLRSTGIPHLSEHAEITVSDYEELMSHI